MTMRIAILIAVTLLVALSAAYAEDPIGWSGEIAPVAWFAGIDGTVTIDGQKTEFEKSASDLFDYVEFASGLVASVQYNRWVGLGQFDYFTMSTNALDVEDRPAGGELDTDIFFTEIGAGYQLSGWTEGQTFDLMAAIRVYHVKNDLVVYGEGGGSFSQENDLVDPMFALRGKLPLFPSRIRGLYFTGLAAIGGGGDSQMVYELQPQIKYQINDMFSARVGFRRAGWQIEDDDTGDELDFSLSGLNLGFGVNF